MATDSRLRANARYQEKAYDQISIRVKKGTRDRWRALAEAEGKSLAAYIVSRVEGAPVPLEAPETAPGDADGSESDL